jgi:adenylate cyclase
MSVHTEPHALVEQLNEYLTAMVECVFRHNGTLDKFIGDAVMAVWGNATTEGSREDALQATRAAFAMREELVRLNAKWRAEGRTEFKVGIALNHGDVIVGNIGSPQRMEFTVIGDAVNATWRLQERTKLHDCELLVGESLAELISPQFATEPLGNVQISRTTSTNYCRVRPEEAPHAAACAPFVRRSFGPHVESNDGVLQPA